MVCEEAVQESVFLPQTRWRSTVYKLCVQTYAEFFRWHDEVVRRTTYIHNPVCLTVMPGVSSKPMFRRWWWSLKQLLAPDNWNLEDTYQIVKYFCSNYV